MSGQKVGAEDMQGWLEKQGQRMKIWSKRYFVLIGTTLRWHKKPEGEARGELALTGPGAGIKRTGKPCCAVITGADRSMTVQADSEATLNVWVEAICTAVAKEKAAARRSASGSSVSAASVGAEAAGSVSPHPSVSLDAVTGIASGSGGSTPLPPSSATNRLTLSGAGGFAPPVTVPLPALVEIAGPPEAGAELRVVVGTPRGGRRAAPGAAPEVDQSLIDAHGLCIVWFRLPAAGGPLEAYAAAGPHTSVAPGVLQGDSDVLALGAVKAIPGATGHAYVPTEADVGCYLGVVVKPAVGDASRWAVLARPVGRPDAASPLPLLRAALQPHEHSRYCDRRVRVCTAAGRVREGEVLTVRGAAAAGGGDVLAPGGGWGVAWYRSEVALDRQLVGDGVPPEASWYYKDADFPAPTPAHRGWVVTPGTAPPSLLLPGLSGLVFRRVVPRAIAELPPAPPDHAPAPALPVIKATMERLSMPRPPPSGAPAASSPPAYPFFADDVGRLLVPLAAPLQALGSLPEELHPFDEAAFVPGSGRRALALPSGVTAVVGPVVGPVEAAPPKSREVWLEALPGGAPAEATALAPAGAALRVGDVLLGRLWYYGGAPGRHLVSWTAINDAGEVVELRGPEEWDGVAPTAAHARAGARHPCVLPVEAAHVGCLVKLRVVPARSDGDLGHGEASRPTAEVQPAAQ